MENRIWFLYAKKLTGEATDVETRELNELLSSKPELYDELAALETVWVTPSEISTPTDSDFSQLAAKIQSQGYDFEWPVQEAEEPVATAAAPVRWLRRPATWIAATAAAAAIIAAVWFSNSPAGHVLEEPAMAKANQVSTRPGSRSKVVLPDGTQVWLNADSKLTYGNDFGVSSRDVTLSGEAYFDVKPNKEVPFYIHTSKIKIKVTGTVFNVRAYPNETRSETSLLHGKVEVTLNSSPDKTYFLKPSDKLVVTDDGGINQTNAATVANAMQKQNRVAPAVQIPVMKQLVVKPDETFPVETAWVMGKQYFGFCR